MAQATNVIQINMIRHHLDDLPDHPLPAPYSIHWYRPGDERQWVRIEQESDEYNPIKPELFAREFGTDAAVLAARQCYLCDGSGAAIGTSTAWFDSNYHGQDHGRIHWVAIVPSMQGRGLAKPLLSASCRRLRELGHTRAYLVTQTPRIPAICLYLKFGFVPEIRSERDRQAWELVRERLPEALREKVPQEKES